MTPGKNIYGDAPLKQSELLKADEKPKVFLKRIVFPYNKTVYRIKLLIIHIGDLSPASFSFGKG